jgi:methionyl-tRNA synthetase
VDSLNADVSRVKPWELLNAGDPAIHDHLNRWLDAIYRIGYWLEPFLPSASESILEALRTNSESTMTLFPKIEGR